jgi:uncharacterized membrane protein
VAKEFVNPNWHVILIHYPLGVFVLGMLVELFSIVYRRTSLRLAGRWMILLGALAGIPTALSGIYALGNVVRMNLPATVTDPDLPWKQVTAESHLNLEQWEFLRRHVWAQSASTALAVVLVVIGLGTSDRWRRRLYLPILVGLLASLAGMVWGAYYGGELVYRHGTAVSVVQPGGAMPQASVPGPTESAADDQVEGKRKAEYYVPPLQLHVLLAGLAVAFAFGALGLSMRAIAVAEEALERGASPGEPEDYGTERDVLYQPPVPRGPATMDVARSLNPDADLSSRAARLPVSRTWLLAALLAAGAAVAGFWFLGGRDELRMWEPKRLWAEVQPDKGQRRIVHVATGVTIVVVPLLLALVTRVSRRPKVMLTLLSLVLLAAVAGQVWLGVLLMLDTPHGSLYRFNAAEDGTGPPASGPGTAPATAPATQGIAAGT